MDHESYQQSNIPSKKGSKVIYNSGFSMQLMGLLQSCGSPVVEITTQGEQQPLLYPFLRISPSFLMQGKAPSIRLFVPCQQG